MAKKEKELQSVKDFQKAFIDLMKEAANTLGDSILEVSVTKCRIEPFYRTGKPYTQYECEIKFR